MPLIVGQRHEQQLCMNAAELPTDPTPHLQFKFRHDEQCKILCRLVLNRAQAKAFRSKIADDYRVNMCGFFLLVMSPIATRRFGG